MLPGAAELGSSEFREALQAMIPQLQVGRRILSGAAAVPETPNGSNHQGGDSFLPSQSAEAAERGRRSLQQPLARPTGLLHPASILQQQRQVAVAFPLAQEGVDWAPQRPSDQSDQQRPQTRDPHVILSNSGCQLEKETAVVDVAGAAAKERRKIRAEMRQALAKGLSEFPTPLTKGGQTADPCSNEKVWISWEDARSLLIMRQLLSSGQHQEFHRNRQEMLRRTFLMDRTVMHAVVTGKVSREKARTLQKDAFTLVPASDLPPSITPSGADPHQPAAALPCQLQQQSALGRSGPQEQQQTSQPQADPHLHPGSQTHGQTSPQASISFGQWLQSPAEQMHRQPQTRANQQPQPQSQSQPTPQPLALGQPPAQPHEPQPLAQPSQALQSGQNRQEEHNPPEEGQQPGSGEPISGGIPADLPEAAPSRDFQNALQAANDVLRGVAATANGLSDEALRKWQSNVAEALNAKAPGLLAQTLKFLGSSDTNAKAAALPTLLWSSVECPEVAGLIALTQIRAGKAMSRRSAATQQQPQLQGAALEGPGPSADPLSQHVLQPRECPRPLQTPETSEDPTGQPPLETREDPQGQHPLPEEPQPQQRDHRGIDRVPRPLEDPRTDPCSETLEDPQPHQSPPLLEDPQPHREPHDEHLPEAPETHDDPQIARHTEPREDCTDRHVPQLLSDTHTKHVGQLSEARQTDADLRPSPEDVDVSQDPQPIGHTNGSDGAKQRDDMQFQGHCQAQEHPQPRDRPHPLAVHQKDLFGRALGGEGAMRGQMEEGAATQGKKHTRWWAESRPRKRIRVADGASRLAGQGGGDGGMSGLPFGSEAEEGEDVEGPDTLVPGFPAMGVGADQVGGESPSAAADHRGGCQQIPEEMDTAAEGRGGRCSSGNEAPVPLGLPEEAEVDLQESSSGRGDAQGLGLVAATDDVHSCHHPPQEEEAAAPQHASGKSPGRPLRGIAIHLLDDSSSDEEIDIM